MVFFTAITLEKSDYVCLSDWQDAIGVAVLDCAQEENFDVCRYYNIQFYPTFKVSVRPAARLLNSHAVPLQEQVWK